MKKRLVLGGLGVMAILVGLAAFAANTAQWVNVTAHVEKEIAVACVDTRGNAVDCDYGVVFPQNTEEKIIEVALSPSFDEQTIKSGVLYWALWECKLVDPTKPHDVELNPCREDLKPGGPLYLDGNIRDFIDVSASNPACLGKYDGPTDGPAKLEGIGDGTLSLGVVPKCFYHLTFKPPACEGSYNPNTDLIPAAKTVECNKSANVDVPGTDPQTWEQWVDLGDDFKIQVYDFSLE